MRVILFITLPMELERKAQKLSLIFNYILSLASFPGFIICRAQAVSAMPLDSF